MADEEEPEPVLEPPSSRPPIPPYLEEDDPDSEEEDEPSLVPTGNRLRWWRGGAISLVGLIATLVFSMAPSGPRVGVPTVFASSLVLVIGLLDLLGTFDDPEEAVERTVRWGTLSFPFALFSFGVLSTWALVRAAVAGAISGFAFWNGAISEKVIAGSLITAAFLVTIVGVGLVSARLGWLEGDRPLWKRHGFWLLVVVTVLHLPALGVHSLIDPWETHYGEVSREILSRNDWVSLWWGHEGWFWSKPILDFWIQSLSMVVFGVRFEPGQMLAAVSDGRMPYPEWAMRMPIFLMTIASTYVLYRAVTKVFGRRAGLLAGVVLTTSPQWFFLAHQTMTDMPFVAAMVAAFAFVILGLNEADPEKRVRVTELPLGPIKLRVSSYHLLVGAVLMVALPQVVYLITRNLVFNIDPRWGFRSPPVMFATDTFFSGSAGNCGLPGNAPCAEVHAVGLPRFQPAIQALVWLQGLALFLYLNWGERRRKRLFFIAAWFLAAIATMGKGPIGIVIPAAAVLVHLVVEKKVSALLEFEIFSGVVLFFVVAMPWFVAMYVRHGQEFINRLLFHDMYERAFEHVHDTNTGEDISFRYFVWQLGYALFPWVGLAPAALVHFLSRPAGDAKKSTSSLLVIWVVLGFALFSLIQTKFHHYIFPVVPAIAVLIGVYADELLRTADRVPSDADTKYRSAVLGLSAVAGAGLVLLVGRDLAAKRGSEPSDARLIDLFTYNYEREWPTSLDFSTWFWVLTALSALPFLLLLARRARPVAIGGVGLAAGVFTVFCLDKYFVEVAPHWGQRDTEIAYLQANRTQPGPLISYQQNWKGENFYNGNHIAAFPSTGETFRLYIEDVRRKNKIKTFYFFVSPERRRDRGNTSALKIELGDPKTYEVLTPLTLNNKFMVVRATFD